MKDHFINNLNKSIEFTDFICRISLIDCKKRGLDISYYCLQYKTTYIFPFEKSNELES
jgi:hypothetical protein